MDTGIYKHSMPVQIRFSDIDRLNHVNNACYLNFFELGRVHYFNQVLGGVINWAESGFVLARTEIDYIEPLYLNDEIRCYTRVQKLGNKSLVVENTIVRLTKNGEVVSARGTGVLVAMNYLTNESIVLPEEWRKLISEFEAINLTT